MDRRRHRSTLHIALHLLLPGLAGLVAVLAASAADGLVWRFASLLAGTVGLVEGVGSCSLRAARWR